jgi:hypothetical protein
MKEAVTEILRRRGEHPYVRVVFEIHVVLQAGSSRAS